MHFFRRSKRDRGTSLVEVMIAMAIMAIVLIAFLSIMQSASQMSAVSKENAIALSVLQSTMEDVYAPNYSAFWDRFFITPSPLGLDPKNGVFALVLADSDVQKSLATIQALLPRVQGAAPPLTEAEKVQWSGVIKTFKKFPYVLPRTNRLSYETINLYMMPTSDIYDSGGALKVSQIAKDHNFVEYMVEISWKDAGGKLRSESITSRRSQ